MKHPDRIFFTGVPGSRWSGIAQKIEEIKWMNTSDRTPDREYTHGQFTGHKGAYFGKSMELHPILDTGYIDQAWLTLGSCKLIKSHNWAYNLDDVYDFCKKNNSWLMLVYRPDQASFNWWKEAGGFDIKYPCYDEYIDDKNMQEQIAIQNSNMLKFSFKYDLTWNHFSPWWVRENLGAKIEFEKKSNWEDILVSIIK
jgi:hypothetical protein